MTYHAEVDSTVTLKVEGEVASHESSVLESECLRYLEAQTDLALDFSGVTLVDRQGVETVRRLLARGVRLINCWPLLEDQIRSLSGADDRQATPSRSAELGGGRSVQPRATAGGSFPHHGDRRARASAEDVTLVKRMLAGDEAAFMDVVRRHHGSLVRVAMTFAVSRQAAEEIAQEAWLAVLNGLPAFDGESSLKTWIFTILADRARARLLREKREVTFSECSRPGPGGDPAVDPDRFTAEGAWSAPPAWWDQDAPERLLLRREARAAMEETIAGLPPGQRAVVTLRDVEGLDAIEVSHVLDLSESNQRTLLHRARSRVRAALERHVSGAGR